MQILYEIAYGFGCVKVGFTIYTVLPRMRVHENDIIKDVKSGVLVVEVDSGAADPLVSLSECKVIGGMHCMIL